MAATALPEMCAAPTPQHPGSTLWVWPGRGVYLGGALGLSPHTTSVPCVVIGVDEPFTLTVDDEHRRTRSALIVPRIKHQVAAPPSSRMLFCYLDAGRAQVDRWLAEAADKLGGCAVGLPVQDRLIDLASEPDPDPTTIVAAATGRASVPLDPRIADAMRLLLDDPTGTPGAAGLAARAGWSRSHFLRRFSRETGTSLRRYRLWARMVVVARVIADGGDLTRAAADAGFASPSHFSDTFLRMFGLTASDLLGAGTDLVIVDDGVVS